MKAKQISKRSIRILSLCATVMVNQSAFAANGSTKSYEQREYYNSSQDYDSGATRAEQSHERGSTFVVFPLLNF